MTGSLAALIGRLTALENRFLDAIRSQTIWTKTKARLAREGIGMTLDLVKSVAITITRQQLGLPPG